MPQATPEDVLAAYRIILEREPDPGGLAEYMAKVQIGMELRQLRETLLSSEEYVNKERSSISDVSIGNGLTVSADANESEFGAKIHRSGIWEPHIVAIINDRLSPGDVFVDIGANIGVMSFNAARRVGPSGKVIAFEPDLKNFKRFLEGLVVNKFDNVTLFYFALSERAGVLSLAGGSNAFLTTAGTDRRVQTIRGDRILASEPRVDMIKLDIEGFEPFALDGLSETLKRHQPTVLCEFNPRCLRDHASVEPASFADQLFRHAQGLDVIEHDGARCAVESGGALMELWETRNEEAVASGFLPDGMVHFDVLFKATQ